MIRAAVKTTLCQDVIRQIIEAITSEAWKPGQRIPGEMELAERFEVGRNCIREAIKALEVSGILVSKVGKGRHVTIDALRRIENSELLAFLSEDCSPAELIELRYVIEPQAAYWAAERASKADKEKLGVIFDELKERMSTQKDWVGTGFKFHMTIAQMSGNRLLAKLISSLSNELKAQRDVLYHKNAGDEEMIREHQNIFDAIQKGRPAAAREAMEYHLGKVFQTIIEPW
jgi:GntR family transcriptional regulator, transcriptional repressor for pyruvate dehydrogenase complex